MIESSISLGLAQEHFMCEDYLDLKDYFNVCGNLQVGLSEQITKVTLHHEAWAPYFAHGPTRDIWLGIAPKDEVEDVVHSPFYVVLSKNDLKTIREGLYALQQHCDIMHDQMSEEKNVDARVIKRFSSISKRFFHLGCVIHEMEKCSVSDLYAQDKPCVVWIGSDYRRLDVMTMDFRTMEVSYPPPEEDEPDQD